MNRSFSYSTIILWAATNKSFNSEPVYIFFNEATYNDLSPDNFS